MRNKIIAVNAVIVIILGLLSFFIVRQQVIAATSSSTLLSERAKRDVQGASARLQVDALRAERWIASKAIEPATKDAVSRATPAARGDAATAVCDAILAQAKQQFTSSPPALVMVVDSQGKIVGRNGSSLSRGDDIGTAYPLLKAAISKGQSGADVWVSKERSDQFLAVYAPIRDDHGHGVVLGMPINDELAAVNEATAGRGLVLMVPAGDDVRIAANSANTPEDTKATADKAKADVKNAFSTGKVVTTQVGDTFVAAAPLEGLGDGKHAALVVVSPPSLIEGAQAMALPILGVMVLGLILVIVAGWFLGGYMATPIGDMEETLLAVINGQTDRRIELDHAELGGLAFRINQLLNQLMGIEEDTTDDQGRVSKAPTAADFRDAMAVDRSGGGGGGGGEPQLSPAQIQALATEPPAQYYARLYREYITAKKALGEETSHITEATFNTRIQGMEQDAAQKHGRAVRYQVHSNGKEVVLLAVPLP